MEAASCICFVLFALDFSILGWGWRCWGGRPSGGRVLVVEGVEQGGKPAGHSVGSWTRCRTHVRPLRPPPPRTPPSWSIELIHSASVCVCVCVCFVRVCERVRPTRFPFAWRRCGTAHRARAAVRFRFGLCAAFVRSL